ncbi:hypothetical protein D5H78_12650 [Vallicoccus soli]|uniref:Uncharacterized protein n=1 Tax=Vallicoccus soli TaxID=2339232 RepID=A0A3A3YZI6_9ACTN|nr:hypothetical protein D5H78_12650 [Vallicoccus soli]
MRRGEGRSRPSARPEEVDPVILLALVLPPLLLALLLGLERVERWTVRPPSAPGASRGPLARALSRAAAGPR